jgi:regulator of protease activity HflC (stomatin/prohibitin superfamily)
MRNLPLFIAIFGLLIFGSSCRVVQQGDVGVKRKLGKIAEKPIQAGPKAFNPFITRIIMVPVRTINLEVKLDLPSKEGLNVTAEISILYHVDQAQATTLIEKVGEDYENVLILPIFRAAAADISSKFMAKDMHTGNRMAIESDIKQLMSNQLAQRGIIVESVLMKSILLPPNLYRAVEEKLQAEQEAQRMEFILLREKQEAERKMIEAEGIKNSNKLISEGLNKEILQFLSIEAFDKLSKSPNAKVIITNGEAPFLINP